MPLRTRTPLPSSTWPNTGPRRHLQAPSALGQGHSQARRPRTPGRHGRRRARCQAMKPPGSARRCSANPKASRVPGVQSARRAAPEGEPIGTTPPLAKRSGAACDGLERGSTRPALVPRRSDHPGWHSMRVPPSQMTRVSPKLSKSFDQPRPTRHHCHGCLYGAGNAMQPPRPKLYGLWKAGRRPVENPWCLRASVPFSSSSPAGPAGRRSPRCSRR